MKPLTLADLDPAELAIAQGDWAAQDPLVPMPGWFADNPEGWLDMHNSFCARASRGDVRVLFFGDSITQGWLYEGEAEWNKRFAGLPAANFAIGGDRTQQLLWRMKMGTLEGIAPELVVLKIGVNNIWALRHSPEEVAAGVAAVVRELQARVPGVKVLLQGLLPTAQLPTDPYRAMVTGINGVICGLADGAAVRFVDFGSAFVEADGTISEEIMPDFCHLSPAGYSRWADLLEPEILGMLG